MTKKTCNCTHPTKAHHTEKEKKDLISRLNRIEGQIRGIGKMIAQDVYCDDILNQMSAVKAAINGTQGLLLKKHIQSCVVDQIQSGNLEVINELMTTIEKMKK